MYVWVKVRSPLKYNSLVLQQLLTNNMFKKNMNASKPSELSREGK